MKLSQTVIGMLWSFYSDDRNEGDINEYSTTTVVEAIKHRLIRICACSRPFRNAKLTRKGVKEAQRGRAL